MQRSGRPSRPPVIRASVRRTVVDRADHRCGPFRQNLDQSHKCGIGHGSRPSKAAREQRVVHDLAERGWTIGEDFLSHAEVDRLATEARRLDAHGAFREARVGRGPSLRPDASVRTDRVSWIAWETASRTLRLYHERMQHLRYAINRELQLGLLGFEAHFAVYDPGAFYRTHLDRFRGAEDRVVSVICYLNDGWQDDDGGALRLYVEGTDGPTHIDVAPVGGRLVLFASDRFAHEVLAARRRRVALAGWFTARPR